MSSVPVRTLLAGLTILFTLVPEAGAADGGLTFKEVDYSKVERRIRKEPRYVAPPLYGLFILDPAGDFRVWAVFDKSRADLSHYDVLYFDLNGNGDLTEPGERFTGKSGVFQVGKVPVPGTPLIHTDLRFATIPKSAKAFNFWMKWNEEHWVTGEFPKLCDTAYGSIVFAPSPAGAPILRPTTLGPLSFALRDSGPVTLRIGGANHITLLIGSAGSGADRLWGLDENFLVPGRDLIVATLIAKERDGKEVRSRNEIKEHC